MGANDVVAWMLRSPLHGLVDSDMMLVTMTGRKSGKPITTPVNYVRDGNTLWVTSTRERTWWRNLRAGAPATLLLKGKEVVAQGEAIENDEAVAAGFTRFFALRPKYASTFKVKLGSDGRPDPASLSELVKQRVVVKFTL
jgi:deazaflavin-dependent oxidoreductase (nitroreductase family)